MERLRRTCNACQVNNEFSRPEPITRTLPPSGPWHEYAIDVLGLGLTTFSLVPAAWSLYSWITAASAFRLLCEFGSQWVVSSAASELWVRQPVSSAFLNSCYFKYQYCAANKLQASFSSCSNAVKNVLFRSFCTPMYASQLWCNFRKSCMQRLRVAYNFGCRALYILPWRASVSSHQVQCNIPTFEALLRKYKYLFLERCRKSNNLWLRALMPSDCLYSSLFFEHYNRILLCEWVIELCSVRLIVGMISHNAFAFYLD